MSSSDFVKGQCRHCGGHLEFPLEAVGSTVPCPHCQQPTELLAPVPPPKTGGNHSLGLVLVAVCLVATGLAGGYFYWQKAGHGGSWATSTTPAPTNSTTPTANFIPGRLVTNNFAILPFKLVKTEGSSLVYVTGSIKNLANSQRFGVKVLFSLFDTNDTQIGTATDYESVFEPHGEWHFKALVIESKAVSAKFNSIVEEK